MMKRDCHWNNKIGEYCLFNVHRGDIYYPGIVPKLRFIHSYQKLL